MSEGVVASSRYPKHWLTVGDPAREFTMTQSAPLMVLPDPDEFVVVTGEIIRERGRNAPVSFFTGG
ncbi:phage major head protein [Escherichia coli]|uniref:Phage major head protein n=1 Tax=Escherichia coli TaxID=562 RepID=A0A377EAZ8_ECOLX|nr:phage major head protein [Escherichia coli]